MISLPTKHGYWAVDALLVIVTMMQCHTIWMQYHHQEVMIHYPHLSERTPNHMSPSIEPYILHNLAKSIPMIWKQAHSTPILLLHLALMIHAWQLMVDICL